MSLLAVAITLAFMATIYSLVRGISSMNTGGTSGGRTSEQWMIRRVVFQALAVLLIVLALME